MNLNTLGSLTDLITSLVTQCQAQQQTSSDNNTQDSNGSASSVANSATTNTTTNSASTANAAAQLLTNANNVLGQAFNNRQNSNGKSGTGTGWYNNTRTAANRYVDNEVGGTKRNDRNKFSPY